MSGNVPRIQSLDGLRGLAALIVLVHHSLLTVPILAKAYYGNDRIADKGDALWIFTYTPFHLLWAGTEAVYIFFILSGLVLALPVLHARAFQWSTYYPRRLVRLYLPVVAAIIIATATIEFSPRSDDTNLGNWLIARPNEYPAISMMQDAILLGGVSRVVSPLWSLRWEVLFSIALPLYILIARKWPLLWPIKACIIIALLGFGAATSNSYMKYLPMFAVGVLIASEWRSFEKLALSINEKRNSIFRPISWTFLLVAAILMLMFRWVAHGYLDRPAQEYLTLPVTVIGASLLLFCAAFCPAFKGFLSGRTLQWLGRISFSLYLTHEPIVIAIRFAYPEIPVAVTVCAAMAVALGVAQAFYTLVEARTIELARSTGRIVQRRFEKTGVNTPAN